MSKSRKHHKWYDEDDDYDRDSISRERDRRKLKKLKTALKTKNLDTLKELEND